MRPEEDKKRKRVAPYRPKNKRKKLMRPRQWPVSVFTRDIDLMKLENLHGGFCSCGARITEFCVRCFNNEEV